MATEVTRVIDPDMGSGYNYDSLVDWEADRQRNLVTADEIEIAKCRCTGGTADTGFYSLDGWTTDSTRYIKIWTDPSESYRHAGKWDASKYRIDTANYSLSIKEPDVWIDGLQFLQTGDTGYHYPWNIWIASTDVLNHKISNTIFKGNVGASGSAAITDDYCSGVASGSTLRIWNTVIYDYYGGTYSCGIVLTESNLTAYIYNVTIQNCQRNGIWRQGGTVICKNVLIQDCGSSCYYGTFDLSCTNNCSDDNTQPGSNGRNGEVSFVDEDGDDFHLSASDTVAKGYGINLYDDSYLSFQTDIDGDDRGGSGSTWDIGADEYVAAGTSAYPYYAYAQQ